LTDAPSDCDVGVTSWIPRRRDESGSALEAVVVIPVAMLVLFFAVQACLWAHASTLVHAAAAQGDEVACVEGGSLAGGAAAARLVLGESAKGTVLHSSERAILLPGDAVEIRVTGTAESIVPWINLPVAAVEVGTRQEFRVSG
jgi:hypothetical protein